MLLRFPQAIARYQTHVAPRLGRGPGIGDLAGWTRRGRELVERSGMHGIRFDRDGVWIDDGDGGLWAYEPAPVSTTLWTELGVRYEQGEIDALASRLPAGGTLVDVGANIGLHAVTLARTVEGLEVLAFEPVGETFALLNRNIAKNGVADRVTARRFAVSDRPGTVRLTTRLQFANFIVPEGTTAVAEASEEVPSRTLDDLVEEFAERVDAIKCDVEGAELMVLRGAERTLERFHPVILIEVDERCAQRYNPALDVFTFLLGRGYGYQRFVDGSLAPPSGTPEEDLRESCNFLFEFRGP